MRLAVFTRVSHRATRQQWHPAHIALLLLAFVCCGCSRQARIELGGEGNSDAHFDVVGLSAAELAALAKRDERQRAAVLQVFVVSDLVDPPSVLGNTSVVGNRLVFTPRYPVESGLRYRVVLRRAGLSDQADVSAEIAADFEIRRPAPQAPTAVTHIYPTSDVLPENQLKFYIHFSAPMSRGEAYKHIHLFDAAGKEVEAAFLELGEELWDAEQTRFTLLCDPGRVKRGLKPREELGPVLHEGQNYTLVVNRDWRDATGAALAEPARKTFRVVAPDETPIDTATWKIEPPRAGSTDALVVRFPESLDHSLLGRVLWVTRTGCKTVGDCPNFAKSSEPGTVGHAAACPMVGTVPLSQTGCETSSNAAGDKLAGEIEITDRETCWRFTPSSAWPSGEFRLVVETTLEDLAGNAIGRAFEVDEFRTVQETVRTETVSLPFTVRNRD
jgi:hypothetical protein